LVVIVETCQCPNVFNRVDDNIIDCQSRHDGKTREEDGIGKALIVRHRGREDCRGKVGHDDADVF